MTVEIAIMNMNGKALAADSGDHVVIDYLNFLIIIQFGIKVFGKNDYLSAPCETMIKMYRNKLKDKHSYTLEQYVTRFLRFVDNSNYEDLPSDSGEAQFGFDVLILK